MAVKLKQIVDELPLAGHEKTKIQKQNNVGVRAAAVRPTDGGLSRQLEESMPSRDKKSNKELRKGSKKTIPVLRWKKEREGVMERLGESGKEVDCIIHREE